MNCSSEPGVIAAGAGALPGARRRCEAGTSGEWETEMDRLSEAGAIAGSKEPRTCRADVASPPRTALALGFASFLHAAETTVTQTAAGATWSLNGETSPVPGGTYTYTITLTAGPQPGNEYAGFHVPSTSTSVAHSNLGSNPMSCGTGKYFCASFSPSHIPGIWNNLQGHHTIYTLINNNTTITATLAVTADTPIGTTISFGAILNNGRARSGGMLLTVSAATTTTTTTNTAPTAADKTVTTGEDLAYAFTADDFGFDDADAGDTLASVTIVTVPSAGTLALDGTAVMADDVVTKAQIDGDMLTFTPARDAHGDPYTTFTFTVNDGTDDSASAYTMTIDVTDAPAPVCGVPGIAGAGRRQIWTGTVTVERFEFSGSVSYGFAEGLGVTLLPSQSFFIGSNSYVIDSIAVAPSGNLHFSLDGFSVRLTVREIGALRLHVCDGDYDFNTADESENTTTWLATTLDWSPPVVTRTEKSFAKLLRGRK